MDIGAIEVIYYYFDNKTTAIKVSLMRHAQDNLNADTDTECQL